MIAVFPASMMMADTAAAMLSASGHAMLNGAGVVHSTTVFAGDKIETAKDSAATINVSGSTVLVPASSSIQFKGDAIQLQSGSAIISTTKGLKAKIGELTVAPTSGTAKFEVSTSGEQVMIAARTGSLSLTDANGTTTLQAGDTSSGNGKARKGGAVPGMGGGGGAGAIGSLGSKTAIAIGAAAIAAAIAIALVSSDSPGAAVSPAVP